MTHVSANPDRHFLVVDAKMMGHFTQYGVPHLLAHAVRVAVTVEFNAALVNGNDLGVCGSVMAIGSQWDTFIESQQRVAFFDTYPLQYLFARFILYSYIHVFHTLLELLLASSKRFLNEAF